jgi:hypothetical protein
MPPRTLSRRFPPAPIKGHPAKTIKTWFITAASLALGRAFAEHAIERGFKVVFRQRKHAGEADFGSDVRDEVCRLVLFRRKLRGLA